MLETLACLKMLSVLEFNHLVVIFWGENWIYNFDGLGLAEVFYLMRMPRVCRFKEEQAWTRSHHNLIKVGQSLDSYASRRKKHIVIIFIIRIIGMIIMIIVSRPPWRFSQLGCHDGGVRANCPSKGESAAGKMIKMSIITITLTTMIILMMMTSMGLGWRWHIHDN